MTFMTLTVPTRISKNRESCLDVILTNVPAFAKDSGVIHTGLSDHDPHIYGSENPTHAIKSRNHN